MRKFVVSILLALFLSIFIAHSTSVNDFSSEYNFDFYSDEGAYLQSSTGQSGGNINLNNFYFVPVFNTGDEEPNFLLAGLITPDVISLNLVGPGLAGFPEKYPAGTCQAPIPSVSLEQGSETVQIPSADLPDVVGLTVLQGAPDSQEILESNYYMKAQVFLRIVDNGAGGSITHRPIGDSDFSGYTYQGLVEILELLGSIPEDPHILLKDEPTTIDISSDISDLPPGDYTVSAIVVPIDGKCDYNNENGIEYDLQNPGATSNEVLFGESTGLPFGGNTVTPPTEINFQDNYNGNSFGILEPLSTAPKFTYIINAPQVSVPFIYWPTEENSDDAIEDFRFVEGDGLIDPLVINSGNFEDHLSKYQGTDMPGSLCGGGVGVNFNPQTNVLRVQEALNSPFLPFQPPQIHLRDLFEDHYFMKASLGITVTSPTGTSSTISNIPDQLFDGGPYNFGGTSVNKHLLLKDVPKHLPINWLLDELQQACLDNDDACGDYTITFTITPIDGKCDFDKNGNLNGETTDITFDFTYSVSSSPITPPIGDGDIEADEDSVNDAAVTPHDYQDPVSEKYILPRRTIYDRSSGEANFIDKTGNLVEIEDLTSNPGERRVALLGHKIKTMTDAVDLREFVQRTADAMRKATYEETREVVDDDPNNPVIRTTISLDFGDLDKNKGDIVVYKVFPKGFDTDSITTVGGTGRMFIRDIDPVIGWHFGDDEDGEIEYEGDGDEGTIIITQEPVLYNVGDVVVNYRELGCEAGEAHLFDLADIEASHIYDTGTSIYQVCVDHADFDLSTGNTDIYGYLLDYTSASSSMSRSEGSLGTSIYINDDGNAGVNDTWSISVGVDNPGDHSCLGSFDGGGLFGDCDYEPANRIWLTISNDITPPEISLSYPTLSHSIPLTITITDTQSSQNSFFYCVYDEESLPCDPETEGEFVEANSVTFTLSCEYDWGCVKYVSVFAHDVLSKNMADGNAVRLEGEEIRLIDKGSACRADCTASPSPNRFLSECRNLNSCTYAYHEDDGDDAADSGITIADRCDFLTPGAYVTYNATHEILCPNGPIRESKFTNLILDTQGSFCDLIKTTPYVTFFEGQQILLSIVSCIDLDG